MNQHIKTVLDAIEDLKSMNVSLSVEHVKAHLALTCEDVPDRIVERVVYFVENPLVCRLVAGGHHESAHA